MWSLYSPTSELRGEYLPHLNPCRCGAVGDITRAFKRGYPFLVVGLLAPIKRKALGPNLDDDNPEEETMVVI